MGNYFSKLASSSKDKGIIVADLTKLLPADRQYDEKPKKKKSNLDDAFEYGYDFAIGQKGFVDGNKMIKEKEK